MSSISIGNINNINTTYVVKKSSQSEINSLIKERESLQKELESLQKEINSSGGEDSKTVEVQIKRLYNHKFLILIVKLLNYNSMKVMKVVSLILKKVNFN